MALREWKRPVSLTLLVICLVMIGTGLYLWLSPHGPGGGYGGGHGSGYGGGYGRGMGHGISGGVGETSFRHLMKDIHLYVGLFSVAVIGLHIACNWKAMLRHLGLLKDEPHKATPNADA